MGERIGYARVSSQDQSWDIQVTRLQEAGCQRIYKEKFTGTRDDRPELTKCLDYVREGDTFCITRVDRLARHTLHLCQLAATLEHKGVALVILDQNIETESPAGRLHFQMLGVIAEFETALRRERQMEGIAHRRALGKPLGRAKRLSPAQVAQLTQRHKAGWSLKALAQEYQVGKSTLCRYLAAGKLALAQPAQAEVDSAD